MFDFFLAKTKNPKRVLVMALIKPDSAKKDIK